MKIPRHLTAGAVSLPAVSQNRALFGAAATKGERAFCGAATGGVDSPLWVMGGCIELRTAWPHHLNNRTRWCAGSAWVKGVPSDCVLSMG